MSGAAGVGNKRTRATPGSAAGGASNTSTSGRSGTGVTSRAAAFGISANGENPDEGMSGTGTSSGASAGAGRALRGATRAGTLAASRTNTHPQPDLHSRPGSAASTASARDGSIAGDKEEKVSVRSIASLSPKLPPAHTL